LVPVSSGVFSNAIELNGPAAANAPKMCIRSTAKLCASPSSPRVTVKLSPAATVGEYDVQWPAVSTQRGAISVAVQPRE
jgi:hypothetical protein